MPKVELEFDVDELEKAEWSEESFNRYEGEEPPSGIILKGFVSKIWWTKSAKDDEMLKVIFQAEENEGDLDEYNGWERWENLTLTAAAKFRWKPFIDAFGIKLGDIKSKMKLEPEDDNVGSPVTHIASFEVGSDAAWCRIVTKRYKYNGQWRAEVDKWLPYAEEEEEEEQEEEPPSPPKRSRTAAAKSPASRTPATTPARDARKARATEPVEEEPDEPDEEEAPPPRRGGRTAPAGRTAAAAPAWGRGRGRSGGAIDNEPPF